MCDSARDPGYVKPTGTTKLGLKTNCSLGRDLSFHISRKLVTSCMGVLCDTPRQERTPKRVGPRRSKTKYFTATRRFSNDTWETLFQNLKALQELYVDNDFHA
jgi:hypothetical protein